MTSGREVFPKCSKQGVPNASVQFLPHFTTVPRGLGTPWQPSGVNASNLGWSGQCQNTESRKQAGTLYPWQQLGCMQHAARPPSSQEILGHRCSYLEMPLQGGGEGLHVGILQCKGASLAHVPHITLPCTPTQRRGEQSPGGTKSS